VILPTKHISEEHSLLRIGGDILKILSEPKTISRLWDEWKSCKVKSKSPMKSFDWFVLALDLLFVLNCITFESGKIRRVYNDPSNI
jgi:hypothetical protein